MAARLVLRKCHLLQLLVFEIFQSFNLSIWIRNPFILWFWAR